jgi:hypothetical protein
MRFCKKQKGQIDLVQSGLYFNAATTYSPTHFRVQYRGPQDARFSRHGVEINRPGGAYDRRKVSAPSARAISHWHLAVCFDRIRFTAKG